MSSHGEPTIKFPRRTNKKECTSALPGKFIEIKEWLVDKVFDILCIQETKIDSTFPNSQFHVNGYNIFRRDRKKGGGGIYDLDSLNNSPTRISSQCSSCLDVILTNVPGYFRESGTLEVGLSDHCLVYTIRNYRNLKPKSSGCALSRILMKALLVETLVWFLFRRLTSLMTLKMYIGLGKNCSLKFWMTMLQLNRFDENMANNFNL